MPTALSNPFTFSYHALKSNTVLRTTSNYIFFNTIIGIDKRLFHKQAVAHENLFPLPNSREQIKAPGPISFFPRRSSFLVYSL